MNVSFSPSVASLDANEGLILAGGTDGDKDYKTYTISVENSDNKRTFYLQMNLGSSNTWTWQDQEGNPQISVTTGAGTIRPYPGNSKQLVWSIPEDKNLNGMAYEIYGKTVTFTVKVPQGQTFCINHIALECIPQIHSQRVYGVVEQISQVVLGVGQIGFIVSVHHRSSIHFSGCPTEDSKNLLKSFILDLNVLPLQRILLCNSISALGVRGRNWFEKSAFY